MASTMVSNGNKHNKTGKTYEKQRGRQNQPMTCEAGKICEQQAGRRAGEAGGGREEASCGGRRRGRLEQNKTRHLNQAATLSSRAGDAAGDAGSQPRGDCNEGAGSGRTGGSARRRRRAGGYARIIAYRSSNRSWRVLSGGKTTSERHAHQAGSSQRSLASQQRASSVASHTVCSLCAAAS